MPTEVITRKEPVVSALPYDLTYLPEDLRKKAKLELFEDEETRVHSLKLLRTMLNEDPNLYYMDDDTFLMAFLRARKFDVKRAHSLVKTFYVIKKKHPELYENFNYDMVTRTLEENSVGVLPYRDSEGCVIIILHAGRWCPSENSMADIMRVMSVAITHGIFYPATQIAGFKVIVDFKGFSVNKLTYISPTYLLLFAEALQNCFPARFKGVHVVNEGHLFGYIWGILKQFLTKKLKERFVFHGKNVNKLHKHFSPSILPQEYGGELPPFDNSEWAKKVAQKRDVITFMQNYGYTKKNKVAN